jgi:Fic/DOC family N-terminal
MPKRTTGRYERVTAGGEKVDAFVPFGLPPARPALVIDGKLEHRLREAEQALRRLDLAGEMVPSLDRFIYAFVRKEAVISSQIEGTRASLVDLLAFEAEEESQPTADVEEVTNYLDALAYARGQLASKRGLPLSPAAVERSAQAVDARRARREQATPGNTPQPELDRRKPAGKRCLCSAAARQSRTASQRSREIHPRRRPAAKTRADGALARAVRNHSFTPISMAMGGSGA